MSAEVLPESAVHCSALLCEMAQRTPRNLLIVLKIKCTPKATNQAVARSNRAGRAIQIKGLAYFLAKPFLFLVRYLKNYPH